MARQAQRDFGRQTERMQKYAFATQAPRLKKSDIDTYLGQNRATRDEDGRVWINSKKVMEEHKTPFTEQDDGTLWYAYWQTCILPPGVKNASVPNIDDSLILNGTKCEIIESLLLMTNRRKYGAFRLQCI